LKFAFRSDEARLLLARHQVEVLGRIALNAAHQLDLIVLLPRVEAFDQFLESLGTFFVKLMRKVDGRRCRSRQRRKGRSKRKANTANSEPCRCKKKERAGRIRELSHKALLRMPILAGGREPGKSPFTGAYMDIRNDVVAVLDEVLSLKGRAREFALDTPLLVTTLEEQFGFTVEDDEIDGSVFASLATLIDFVEGKLAA
jgi:acyl carrier protein